MRIKNIYIGKHLMHRLGDEIVCNCGLSYMDENEARQHWNQMLKPTEGGYSCKLGDGNEPGK